MKQLVLIIHDNLKQDVADLLRNIKQVKGFTFSSVEGHGPQSEYDMALAARDKVVGFTPHSRIDMLLEDQDVDPVLAKLSKSGIGLKKNGIYWVTPVEVCGRI